MLRFEDFQKIDLRVAKVIEAEKVGKSENLLKLRIDLGDEKRHILAGIAQNYKPEDLIGREIVVVANLEPRMIFGVESKGMLLAADHVGGPVLLRPDKEVPPGTKVR